MGWVDGFQIPVANRENKALEDKVAALLLKKVNATVKLENVTSKYDALEKHLKNVTNESEEHQVSFSFNYIYVDMFSSIFCCLLCL